MGLVRARRTPPERSGTALCPRAPDGRLLPIDALQRFAAKCTFDATTGCVLWTGGTTQGRGNSAVYGSFWYEGARWFAHRWAAVHIHGLPVAGVQVGHCCPGHPNTLCVQHITPQTQLENLAELHGRQAARRVEQSNDEHQHWLFVSLGIREQETEPERDEGDGVPWYDPPDWLRPFLPVLDSADDCPF